MKNLFTLIIAVFVVSSVSFGQTKAEKKKLKEEKKEQGFQEMKTLINSGTYEFEGEWAVSHTGRRVNLISNPTFIKIDKDEVYAFLPFFGQRYSGGGYGGTDAGIEFKTIEDYEVTFNEKKKQINVNFTGKGKSDNYICKLTIFPNGNTAITVTSNHRSIMRYDGTVKELTKKDSKN